MTGFAQAVDASLEACVVPGFSRIGLAVRARPGPGGTRYAALYEGLAEGSYTLWADHDTPAARLTITGGRVTSHHW